MLFEPILRFAVMSDVHYDERMLYVRERFQKAMETIYRYCDNSDYKALDALYVVGDFANLGWRSQMEMFKADCDRFVKADTMLVVTLANHELHYVQSDQESVKNFQEIFQMDMDRHEVLKDYHFISLSTMKDKGPWHDSFDENKRNFLKEKLEEARQDGDNRPIFVFQHPGISGTVANGLYGNNELTEILLNYPQVIDFSGHSHAPTNHPREIHQKHFTSVSTGGLLNVVRCEGLVTTYMVDPPRGADGKPYPPAAHMLVVEVDANSTVRIRRLDVIAGDFFENDSILEQCWDRTKHRYTLARAKTVPNPYFEKGTQLHVERTDSAMVLTFPRAKSEQERVQEYCARVLDEKGTLILQKTVPSDYHVLHQQEQVSITLEGQFGAHGRVCVAACGFWDNYSQEICANF